MAADATTRLQRGRRTLPSHRCQPPVSGLQSGQTRENFAIGELHNRGFQLKYSLTVSRPSNRTTEAIYMRVNHLKKDAKLSAGSAGLSGTGPGCSESNKTWSLFAPNELKSGNAGFLQLAGKKEHQRDRH